MIDVKEEFNGRIYEVTAGKNLRIGGQRTLPFLTIDDETKNPPRLGIEIVADDSIVEKTENIEEEYKPDLLSIAFENQDSTEEIVSTAYEISKNIETPLIIYGCEDPERDKEILSKCAEVLSGKNIILGYASEENYRTIAASAIAYGHIVIAQTSIDVNLAKQLNILLSDVGVKKNRILIDPLASALGYGLEYTYSVIERIRLAGLSGDEFLAQPVICNLSVCEKAREATSQEYPGSIERRKMLWEAVTGMAFALAGADVLVFRNIKAFKAVRNKINQITGDNSGAETSRSV